MKYKILYFLDYGKSFGGAANTLLQQAILMKKAGHEVTIFMSDYYGIEIEKGYKEICIANQITFNWLTYQICSHTEDIDIICLLQNYEFTREIVKKYKPDILHSVQINPLVELVGRDLKIPHIMNIYQLIPAFFSVKYMNIFPYYHICDSKIYAEKWNYYLETDYTCIRTVVNKDNKQEKKVKKDKELNYICVGSVDKRKNQLGVIKAFHRALLNGLKGSLAVYGYKKNAYGEQCQRYIEENNLQEKISMKGFCSDMQQEYAHADILICGSRIESYPNVISEAMANRLIVVSTPVAGVPEIVKDGINGYLSYDYSVEAICDKILESYNDYKSGKINNVLESTYETYLKNHSPKVVTENLIKYYSYVVQNNKDRKNIDVSFIKNKFSDIIYVYEKNKRTFSDSKFVGGKLWYIYHIKDILMGKSKNTYLKYYIWGTGKYAKHVKEIIDIFFPDIEISGFLDTYKQGKYMEKDIWDSGEIIKEENSIIFVGAINGQNEMIEQLEENNKRYNQDFFIIAPRSW